MAQTVPYKDTLQPIETRVKDLLSRMTLEEKIAQMCGVLCPWGKDNFPFKIENGAFSANEEFLKKTTHGTGFICYLNMSIYTADAVDFHNALQKDVMERTRLGIPYLFIEEACHGLLAQDTTMFPLPPAMASTFDPELIRSVFDVVGKEARARGATVVASPNLDIGRDARWGRVEETFGEDTHLTSSMAVASVQGLQGSGIGDPRHVVATPKHFAGFAQSEGGKQMGAVEIGERMFREEILPPFKNAVMTGKAGGIMPAYVEIDGVPCHANTHLLRDILRDEWGFKGAVISDFGGVEQLNRMYHIVNDNAQAAGVALAAGVDVDLHSGVWFEPLLAKAGMDHGIAALIDQSCARILELKFRLGLFDRPYADKEKALAIVHCKEHEAINLKVAQEAITLLTNVNKVLPLDKGTLRTVAVVGPQSRYLQFGGVSGHDKGVNIFDGIREYLGSGVNVLWAQGCALTNKEVPLPYLPKAPEGQPEKVMIIPAELEQGVIAEAVELAAQADVAIVCIGGSQTIIGENQHGDRSDLELIGQQIQLLREVKKTGKPVIAVLIHGRPLALQKVVDNADAVLTCWNPGEKRGVAVAQMLFGDINPSGKLPFTMPLSAGHIPVHYSQKRSALRKKYAFEERNWLFPFGYGLSYTEFKLEDPRTCRNCIKRGDAVNVMVDVTNTGERDGDTVIQVYVTDVVASVSRPEKLLKGFKRVNLSAGEKKTVTITLTPEAFEFIGMDMKPVSEPGEFELLVGVSSQECQKVVLRLE